MRYSDVKCKKDFITVLGAQKMLNTCFLLLFSVTIILKIFVQQIDGCLKEELPTCPGKMWVYFWQIEFNVLVKYSVVPSSNLLNRQIIELLRNRLRRKLYGGKN